MLSANREISAAARGEEKVNNFRNTISGLIRSVNTRKEVRLKATKEYNYLFKHDRQWMEEHLPPRKYIKRIDCGKVDDELSVIIEETAKSFYASDPPTQIKRYSIINALPHQNQIT
ncbi:TnsD family Tn7-like transposition protein [Paenibacillus dendritiformis]|uniref:TnsD family Tn7-like transposition protein n=1 Tax=Paenibacillus dendritiformis TaxID=130049 RepID=UPI0009FBD5A8